MSGLVLKINDRFRNRKVDFFNKFTFTLAHDQVASVFGFNYYFDPNNSEHKEMSCVTHFHEVTLEFDGELLMTGNIVNQGFKLSSKKELAAFGGYSKTGVLEDCTIPHSLYPLQSNGLSLKQIAEKLIAPFGLGMVIDPAVQSRMNKSFKDSTAKESQTVKAYLCELATQKNIIISHTPKGELYFTESKTSATPILKFDSRNGIPIGTTLSLDYDGQGMHSEIVLQKQADIDGGNAGFQKIRNPYVLQSVYRPTTKSQSSGDENDTVLAVNRALSDELRNLKVVIETDRWVVDGKIIRPNNTVSIYAPELYIYKESIFFIESVTFTGDQEQTTAVLHCVLPEVYNNKVPVSIFKGINLHA